MQSEGSSDESCGELLHVSCETVDGQVLGQNACVDCRQGIIIWEVDREHTEVSLENKAIN